MIPTRDQIKGASDLKISEPIPVPEWGEGAVLHVKGVSGTAIGKWQELAIGEKGKAVSGRLKAALLVESVCDERGQCVFLTEDADWLAEKLGGVIGRLWAAASEVNGVGAAAAKATEKNSETTPTNDSGTS